MILLPGRDGALERRVKLLGVGSRRDGEPTRKTCGWALLHTDLGRRPANDRPVDVAAAGRDREVPARLERDGDRPQTERQRRVALVREVVPGDLGAKLGRKLRVAGHTSEKHARDARGPTTRRDK